MGRDQVIRRDVLLGGAALAAMAAVPLASQAAATRATYDPKAQFELDIAEVEYRKNAAGRALMARIYRPKGPGAVPRGARPPRGVWNRKDRLSEEPFDRAIASAGALVVAVDMTLAPEAPYPACVQDANYAVRWLKARARTWSGDPSRIGVFGSSSGGHVGELLALRPNDPRYNALPLSEAPGLDARIAYVLMRSPISNTVARYENAVAMKNTAMVDQNTTFFRPMETIHECNPQEILERKEKVDLLPFLIMQGALDDNMRPAFQQKFVDTYRAAGGKCDFTVFEGCVHEWVATPGPQTDRAHEMAKAFIARQLRA